MKIIGFIFAFFILFSCKKDHPVIKSDNDPSSSSSNKNTLNPNVYIIDTLQVLSVSENSFVLVNVSSAQRPKVGDIMLAAPSKNNPDGFLRKVSVVTEGANSITCNTEQANLNEAFKELHIDFSSTEAYSSNKTYGSSLLKSNTKMSSGKLATVGETELKTGYNLTIDFQHERPIAGGISFNGTIHFNIPSIKFQYVKRDGSSEPEKVLIQANFNTDGSTLEISNTNESAFKLGEEVLIDWPLPVLRIPIPIVTVFGVILFPVPFSQNLVFKTLPVTISGRAKWVTLPMCKAVLGIKYENSSWSNISSFSIDATSPSLAKGNFSPALTLEASMDILTPEYEIYPYKIKRLRAFFSIPNSIELTLQKMQPNYSLVYKLDVKGGVKQEFFTGVKQEYSLTGNVTSQTMLEGNWETSLPVVSTRGEVSSITQTSATLGGLVLDDGAGVTETTRGVCWSTRQNPILSDNKTTDGTGPGPFTSNLTGLTPNTKYYVRAYAINSLGTAFGNEVSFTTLNPNDNLSTKILGKWHYTKYTTDNNIKIIDNPFEGTDYIEIRSDGKLYHHFTDGSVVTFNWSISGNTLKIINEDTDIDMQIITLTDTDLKVNTDGIDNNGKIHLVSFFFTIQS